MKKKLYCFWPVDGTYITYQNYYLLGLMQYFGEKNIQFHPFSFKILRYLSKYWGRMSSFLKLNNVTSKLLQKAFPFYNRHNSHVGQYVMSFKSIGEEIRFAIDAHDHHEIRSQEILNWSDIYFKSNKWREIKYPKKVLPIVNGNGILSQDNINTLKSLRDAKKKKEFDLVFISRIWGGREHNVRLFEQLAKLDCRKYLLAIFTTGPYVNEEETKEFQLRIEKAGVPWTYETIPQYQLWDYLAKSRLVVLRAGKHLCIPWRMLDLLCMGACIVYDSDPYPEWPYPLRNHENYVSLGINRPADTSEAPMDEYKKIPEIINKTLKNRTHQEKIRKNNIWYFDNYASTIKVADYIVTQLNDYLYHKKKIASKNNWE